MRALLLLCIGCSSVSRPPAPCPTIAVTGTTERDIQRALDAAKPGTTIVLPQGRVPIAGTLELRSDDVQLLGNATVLVRSRETTANLHPLLRVRASRTRISSIRFEGIADSRSRDIGIQLDDAHDFRVDHCQFSQLGFAGVRTNGTSRGVIDHSTFDSIYKPAIGTEGYGVVVYGTNELRGLPFGADEATFVEDSQFTRCRHAVSSNKGARYVFRHNRVTDGVVAHAVDTHGTEYGSEVGTEWADIYANVIEQPHHAPPYDDRWAVHIRGGRGLVHDNRIRGYATLVAASERTPQPTGPVYLWNNDVGDAKLVRADTSAFALAPPVDYAPPAYPHPLTAPQRCR